MNSDKTADLSGSGIGDYAEVEKVLPVTSAHDRDGVIANISTMIDSARAQQVPVIWVQHADDDLTEGSDGWQYVSELQRLESEPLVHKRYGDSFEDTTLESTLAERGVGRLVVTGAQTDACIRATLHGAFTCGYDTLLVSDAPTHHRGLLRVRPATGRQDKVIAHTSMYWTWQAAPGRMASVVDTAHVTFDATGDEASG